MRDHLDLCSGKLVHLGLAPVQTIARGGDNHSVLHGVVLQTLYRGTCAQCQKREKGG
jgi:hypothetical protein